MTPRAGYSQECQDRSGLQLQFGLVPLDSQMGDTAHLLQLGAQAGGLIGLLSFFPMDFQSDALQARLGQIR